MNNHYRSGMVKTERGIQFIIDIKFQQHNSWQGSVQRMDTGERIFFRSELELLMLMNSATQNLNSTTEQDNQLRKWNTRKENVEQKYVNE